MHEPDRYPLVHVKYFYLSVNQKHLIFVGKPGTRDPSLYEFVAKAHVMGR